MFQKERFKKTILLIVIGFVFNHASAQGFLRTNGQRIINEKGENILLRGMGLGGWMLQEGYMLKVYNEGQQNKIRARITDLVGKEKTAEFYDAWLVNHTRKIDIDSMKAWGFNSVRLPIHYNLYTLPVEQEPVAGENTWLEKGFRMTDSLLTWCKTNGMYLILDLHAAPGGQGNDLNISDGDTSKPSLWESKANQQKTISLWKKLAQRYKDESWIGAYDIINEPNWGFEDPVNDKNGLKEKMNGPLKQLMMDITKAIREADQKHIIIIEGNGWGNNYNGILPPWDNNMVLSFHKYWNYNNQQAIQHILDTRKKYNVPVWLGETGENSNVWFAEAIHLLETNNIGWAWWPLKKLGNNNPMQIRSNPDYEKILSYWAGNGPRPSEKEAYTGVMELAASAKLENTDIKRDVIDALIRQPHSSSSIPYKAHIIADGSTVNAVDYDLGRNGAAYFDTDTADYHLSNGSRGGNRGRMYRNDGVDIGSDSIEKDKNFITHTEPGEWLQYTLNVPKAGKYRLELELNAVKEDGNFFLTLDNKKVTQSLLVPKQAGWQNIGAKDINLKKGKNHLRLYVDKGGFNFAGITFMSEK